jgi:tetratricopeptide (TPR) repeat protein
MTKKPTCDQRQEDLAALVLGELAPAAAAELNDHLNNCAFCRGARDTLAQEEVIVRSAFDAFARSVQPDPVALTERFGKSAQTPAHADRPAALRFLSRVITGWLTMNARYKAASFIGAALIVAGITTALLWTVPQSAYALSQTIEAVKKVRFLHTVMRDDKGQVLDERWIEIGKDGNQARYRQDCRVSELSLLVIDDGNVCYAHDRTANKLMLKPPGSYQWIYNLAEFFEKLAGAGTATIEQNAQYHGRAAHKVRWLEPQIECYIDPKTQLPIAVGPMEVAYDEPPADAFTVPNPPKGVEVIDLRNGSDATTQSPAAIQETERQLQKDKLFKKAREALAAKDYAIAVDLFDQVLKLSPLENWVWYWRGDAHAGLNHWDQAITDYTKVIDVFESIRMTPYFAYYSRGLAWQRKGDPRKAMADLSVALPVMIDALRHPEGGKTFDYADMPTNVRIAWEELTPAQRLENMIRRLRQATGQEIEFRPEMTPQQVEQVIVQWERWWEQHQTDYRKATQPTTSVSP